MIQFRADKAIVRGPKADNSFAITFEVGEHGRQDVKELLGLEPEQVLKVTVETDGR